MSFLNFFTKVMCVVACLFSAACGASAPPPEPETPTLTIKARVYEPESGETVVEPHGPWLGMMSKTDPCRPLYAWQDGYRDAKKAGYEGTLEDGQLDAQILHATSQFMKVDFCRKVAHTTMAQRYGRPFLDIVLAHGITVNDKVPAPAIFAWRQAERECEGAPGDVFKSCVDKAFGQIYEH